MKRTHRERGQLHSRKHLGLLEKHKDYVLRAKDYQRKKAQLQQMHEKARNRNPDEFYYKMVNNKLKEGRHIIAQDTDNYTPEQLQLMKTQDEKYVQMKLAVETKKVERLKSCLHHTNLMAQNPPNQHTIFVDSVEEVANYAKTLGVAVGTGEEEMGSGAEEEHKTKKKRSGTKRNRKKRKSSYKELNQRIWRCKELETVALKIKTQKDIAGKGIKWKVKGDGSHPAVYRWKQERKK